MIQWDDIETVLFDMDGTLLDLFFDNHFWNELVPLEFSKTNTLDIEEGRKQVFKLLAAEEGKLNWYKLEYLSDLLGIDIVGMKHKHKEKISVYPSSIPLLEQLKNKGKHLKLVTDADPIVLEIKLNETGIGHYFDEIISSHPFEKPKMSPEFWDLLVERHPFDKEKTLFVDDNLNVLKAARTFGIKYLLAISKPDSSMPEKEINDFLSVSNISELHK